MWYKYLRLFITSLCLVTLVLTVSAQNGSLAPPKAPDNLLSQDTNATASSDPLQVSLLTCAPGADLYSSFGHTAIRIQDRQLNTDYVFNYGTFQFDQPNFYLKFIRGKLEFMLSISTFDEFMYEYQVTQRSVTEQVLDLTADQKRQVLDFLKDNYQPAKRYYKYDFLYDNCATRIRDILFGRINGTKIHGQIVPEHTSFRDLIYHYLDKGGQPWSKLGIDILLGSRIDIPVDNNTAMFLPDYLAAGIDSATITGHPYVQSDSKIIDLPSPITPSSKYLPLIVISVTCILLFLVYYLLRNKPRGQLVLDSLLLYVTGLLGVLLVFMWLGTDHQACKNNYNLIWAMPLNLIAGFFIWKPRTWVKKYFIFMLILTAILLAFWWGLPQHFNIALLPFCVLMLIRYAVLARKNDIHAKNNPL